MSYFRNKFNEQFLFLCQNQEPKGGSIRLDSADHSFWVIRKNGTYNQPDTVHVIPLLLYNVIESSWHEDLNLENFVMICKNRSDTTINCYYDKNVTSGPDKLFVCKFGVENLTGDIEGQ